MIWIVKTTTLMDTFFGSLEDEEEDRDYDEDGNLVTGIESDTEW